MDEIFHELSEDLNVNLIESEELEMDIRKLDEPWSYEEKKASRVMLAFHTPTRQVLAMHLRKKGKESIETLLVKLPED